MDALKWCILAVFLVADVAGQKQKGECGGNLVNSSGSFGYEDFLQNEDCTWTITSDNEDNSRFLIRFQDDNLNLTAITTLEILDGNTTVLLDATTVGLNEDIGFYSFTSAFSVHLVANDLAGETETGGFTLEFYGQNNDDTTETLNGTTGQIDMKKYDYPIREYSFLWLIQVPEAAQLTFNILEANGTGPDYFIAVGPGLDKFDTSVTEIITEMDAAPVVTVLGNESFVYFYTTELQADALIVIAYNSTTESFFTETPVPTSTTPAIPDGEFQVCTHDFYCDERNTYFDLQTFEDTVLNYAYERCTESNEFGNFSIANVTYYSAWGDCCCFKFSVVEWSENFENCTLGDLDGYLDEYSSPISKLLGYEITIDCEPTDWVWITASILVTFVAAVMFMVIVKVNNCFVDRDTEKKLKKQQFKYGNIEPEVQINWSIGPNNITSLYGAQQVPNYGISALVSEGQPVRSSSQQGGWHEVQSYGPMLPARPAPDNIYVSDAEVRQSLTNRDGGASAAAGEYGMSEFRNNANDDFFEVFDSDEEIETNKRPSTLPSASRSKPPKPLLRMPTIEASSPILSALPSPTRIPSPNRTSTGMIPPTIPLPQTPGGGQAGILKTPTPQQSAFLFPSNAEVRRDSAAAKFIRPTSGKTRMNRAVSFAADSLFNPVPEAEEWSTGHEYEDPNTLLHLDRFVGQEDETNL